MTQKSIFLLILFLFFLINQFFCFDDPLESDFNPCNIDDSTCMPLEDFDQNCTCILLPDQKLYNVSDDVYLFMTGYPIHMSYISQTPIAELFRKKLSIRIPKAHYYDSSEPDRNIYRNLKISEKMALFEVSTDKSAIILQYLIENQFLRTEAITKANNRWCLEGECNAFLYESGTVNKSLAKLLFLAFFQTFLVLKINKFALENTKNSKFFKKNGQVRSNEKNRKILDKFSGLFFFENIKKFEKKYFLKIQNFRFFKRIYSHSADLLQIIEYRSRSIFAVSSVHAEFSVPVVQRLQCEHKCKVFYWNEREMCMKQLEFDLVSVTSDLKRNFDFFVQSSAIQNFRMKYRKFI
ncbi:Protein CBG15793 [Caenorhabditis briggsae]|uniref:Protein CBG15793 n=1 Tax=Caenorhabditis briggsae TaxID=6238 RepID=A8XMT6_CAEBR|nr:Protein CBG15793 [Caenorhabditis briggsae]CAP33962.1 Protein CBG15793 [Caenorhabditis briggsae]